MLSFANPADGEGHVAEKSPLITELKRKILVLRQHVWEGRMHDREIDAWLDNFTLPGRDRRKDQEHALYLLSQFMYFGSRELRALLLEMFRGLFRYPLIQDLRTQLFPDSAQIDFQLLDAKFREVLEKTRFLGIGNPSESGVHLLYYFRQETDLPKTSFIHTHEIFSRKPSRPTPRTIQRALRCKLGARLLNSSALLNRLRPARRLKDPDIEHYVFLDDLCGSGSQATEYSREVLSDVKALGCKAKLHYYSLFATQTGMEKIRSETAFDEVGCVVELDDSYRVFDGVRFFQSAPEGIDRDVARALCIEYARTFSLLLSKHKCGPLGYRDGQLLIGFHHNTPDNTLPVIWYDEERRDLAHPPWTPAFKRYGKSYYWGWA